MSKAHPKDRLSGLKALEIAAALTWITDQVVKHQVHSTQTISTKSIRAIEEQVTLGVSHILLVMYPFAIEIALKALWTCLHSQIPTITTTIFYVFFIR